MNYQQAIQFLYESGMFGARLGLDVTRRLAELAGNPHQHLRFIHVAGTNGKGSTCAILESIYRHAGLRVGLFTSPHLVSFAERIQVNRQSISEADVARLTDEIAPLAKSFPSDQRPTFFEAVTVMALRHFAEQQCDLVIWETGLGGRLDATNIVTPLTSVITTIDFDHQQWLGDTLEKIAAEKAGTIKPDVPVITGAEPQRGLEVILDTARRLNAPLIRVTRAFCPPDPMSGPATILSIDEAWAAATPVQGEMPSLPLLGEHQRFNAALAIATVKTLAGQISVSTRALREGLSQVCWPGRMQLAETSSGQTVLLDGAHNAASAAALREAVVKEFPGSRPALVLGVLADKDWNIIASTLAPLAGRVLLVPVNSARTLPPNQLAAVCRRSNAGVIPEVCTSLEDALNRAESEPFLLITGSLYLVGEAMERLRFSPVPATDERGLNEWSGKPAAVR